MSTDGFLSFTQILATKGYFILYGVTLIPMLFYFIYICFTGLWKNWRLMAMSLACVVMSVAMIFYTYGWEYGKENIRAISYAIRSPLATFVHWLFCYIYLKLTIEVKYMFD